MAKPVHKNQARSFVLGSVALAVISVIAYVGMTVQGGGELPLKSYTFVKAAFDDVGILKEGQDVTQHGVRVGTVRRIELVDGVPVVTMRLEGDRDVYRDAQVSIRNASALGRKQVSLDPGSAKAGLLGDDVIPEARTRGATELHDVFDALDAPARKGLQTGLRELGGGLGGHSEDLRGVLQVGEPLLKDLGTVSEALSSSEADLPAMLESTNRVAGRLVGRRRDLAVLLTQVDSTLEAITVDDGRPLAGTVRALPGTLRQTREALSALNKPLSDVRVAMSTIRPGARDLAASAGDLRGFLRESVDPMDKVPGVANRAVPAVESLTGTMTDARPLVHQLPQTLADANVLLRGLAPYATDIGRFFSEHDLLSGRIAPGKHFFSAMLTLPGLRNVSAPDPLAKTVPYPAPGGGAWNDNPGGGRE